MRVERDTNQASLFCLVLVAIQFDRICVRQYEIVGHTTTHVSRTIDRNGDRASDVHPGFGVAFVTGRKDPVPVAHDGDHPWFIEGDPAKDRFSRGSLRETTRQTNS